MPYLPITAATLFRSASCVGLLVAGLVGPAHAEPSARSFQPQDIAVVLNVINHDYEQITRDQFEKLHAIGFRTVELGAYLKPLSADLQERFQAQGFQTLAHGGSLHDLTARPDEIIAQAKARNQPYLICYWPWLDGAKNITVEQCRESARLLNELGARCRQAGLGFAFHNHAIEFQPLAGQTVMDHLLKYSDPGLVQVEFDVYHALRGGCDVIAFMRAHRDRIPMLHLNTLDEQSESPVAGDGMPGFAGILRTGREIGVRYLIIEGGGLKDPLRYLEESFRRIERLAQP